MRENEMNMESDVVLPVGPLGNKQAFANEVVFPASTLYARIGRLPSASNPAPEGPHAHAHSSKGGPIVQWARRGHDHGIEGIACWGGPGGR